MEPTQKAVQVGFCRVLLWKVALVILVCDVTLISQLLPLLIRIHTSIFCLMQVKCPSDTGLLHTQKF